MAGLLWKLNRLRSMSPGEVAWRVTQTLQKKAGACGFGLASKPPRPSTERYGACFIAEHSIDGADRAAVMAAADQLMDGKWNVFSLKAAALGFPPRWNVDPKTGVAAPMLFGKGINYRDEAIVGDIKYLWEPARHLELVTLALAWRSSREAPYLAACRALLESWFRECPYPDGIHWTSSLELAVRLVNWAFAWHLIGGESSPLFADAGGAAFRERWLSSVYQHCHFISGYLSRHSSANNHLFGEFMGLFVAGLNWPCWPESKQWVALAKRGLEDEAVRQNAEDGVNREQAIYYQHEVMDMMLICHLVASANGLSFADAYMRRLELLAEFVHSIMDVSGSVPMIGDADDAEMVRLAYGPDWNRYRSLLCSCAIIFGRNDFRKKAGAFDVKNRFLFGQAGSDKWDALSGDSAGTLRREFPHGGYWIIGDRFDCADEIRAVVDAGPLGYLSIAAHGHADALSFLLSAGGREFLIDPGTYAYHTQKKWRDYFRGTSAHNTLRVDGVDQSVIGGNFLWLGKADSRCERFEVDNDRQYFSAWHDGYRRLSEPLIHRREIAFDGQSNCFDIVDVVQGAGRHSFELFWHFSESCRVEVRDGVVRAENGPVLLKLSMDAEHGFEGPFLVCGQDDPPLGWISRSFDVKVPTTTAVWRASGQGDARFSTRISLVFPEHES